MPWIHIDDQVALIDYLLNNESCSGPYNACAPEVVRNIDFTQILARS
jgi:NAD dependent epimerase/dehydratase family enzyme